MRSTAFVLLVAGFGGTLFDFGGTIIAPAIPYLESLKTFTAAEISRLTSAVVMGAAISCFLTGFIADRLGRKPTMLLVGALSFAASFPICLSGGDFLPFYVGRIMQGLAAGSVGVVVPMYLVESLVPESRGKGAAVFQLLDIGGIFFCSLVGIAVVKAFGPADSATVLAEAKMLAWQTIFWVNTLPSALFLLGVFALPESPVWLRKKVQNSEFKIKKLTGSPSNTHSSTLFQRKYVVPFVLAVVVLMCNQGTAVTSLQYYTVKLVQDAGLSNAVANTVNGVAMAVFTLATALALPLVDRRGRRPLMVVGTAGVFVSHIAAALVFLAVSKGWLAPGAIAGTLVSVSITSVIFFFGMGPGVVAWLVLSELMPDRIRAVGMSIAMFFNMVVAYFIADSLLIVGERFGYAPMFFLFAASTAVYFLVAVFLLPETRGKTLLEIERLFEK